MIYNLISGIEQAIRREFPESTYRIYTENTEQGMEKPCFFILCMKQSSNAKLGRRFMLNTSFDVQYFTSIGNNECWEAAEKLRSLLGEITVDGCLVRGSNLNFGVESGVVRFFIDYNLPMMQEQEAVEFMEEVTVYGKASEREN
jgi:hypothetical protein